VINHLTALISTFQIYAFSMIISPLTKGLLSVIISVNVIIENNYTALPNTVFCLLKTHGGIY